MKRLIVLIIITFTCVSLFAQDNIRELSILHWNDFHARNVPYQISKKKDGQTTTYFVGGTGSVLGYLNKFRDSNSLVLNGGDDYQGSPISSITNGFSQIELLKMYNLDAFVVGNHEFDYGAAVLDSGLKTANFDVLSANLYLPKEQRTFGKSYVIKEKNGIKIGIIGVSPEDLKSLTLPKNVASLVVLNTDSVITANLKVLKKEKCNLIVLLSHNGADKDTVYAKKFHDIDIIVGGHSHTPIYKPKVVDGIIIVQAGSYGKFLGKLDLKVDIEKDTVVSYFGKLNETVLDSAIFDKTAGDKVNEMLASIEPEMKKVIGKLDIDWKKGNCGQWNADALRTMFKTDIAFMNAGSIRKDMLKGNITVGDIWEINPFGNNIMTFTVKGSTVKKMMANNIRMSAKDEELSGYDMIIESGMKIIVNSSLLSDQSDSFIKSIEINGKPIEMDKDYSIVTNSYTAAQAKKYFGDFGEEIKAVDTNVIDRDALLEAVKQQKVINNVFENRLIDEKTK
ncbi:MAG: bifunctional UDP-sugar hydrolase/5'-nucleotidase [Ignavibacteriota bacterium]